MAAQENWWDSSPIVAKPNQMQQVGNNVYVPPVPEKPEKPEETFRTMTQEEATASGLDPTGVYQISNTSGKMTRLEAPNKAAKVLPENSAQKLTDDVNQVDALNRAINGFNDDYAGSVFTSAESLLQGLASDVGTPGQRNWWADFKASDNVIRNTLFGASLTPGEKSSYEATTITPSMDPKIIKENLQKRLGIVQKATQRRYNRLNAAGYNKEEIEAIVGDVPIIPKPVAETPPASAGGAGGSIAPIEAGKAFQTEADLDAQRQMQAAWNAGKSADEIIALNQQIGRGPLSPADIQRMRDARTKGGSVSFYGVPTGQPTAAEGLVGAALSTPVGEAVGGYAVGAANALTAGTLDELAPILGLDPFRVQAAKDYLRKRAPVSSFVGEVTGGILGSIPAVRGAGAALAGTRLAGAAPLAGEILYGAGYGAGEAPTGERLTGALIGGGAAGIGGALANRFLPGGPGTFSGMTPDVPPAAVIPDVPIAPSQYIAQPPPGAPLPSAGGAIELTADDLARFTTAEDRAMFNQAQLGYIARSRKLEQQSAPAAQAAPTPTPEPAPMPQAAPAAAPAPTPEMAAELGTIIRDASGTGSKAKNAQIKLAEMAQINPEAKASAERLGIEVPADVFSDNPQVRAAIGLTRSLAGSEAEAGFRTAVANAVDQADNVMREFDAQFVEGAVSPGTVSQRVKDSLTKTRSDLNAEASAIYKRVDESVPKQTPVQMDNLFRELTAIAGEVGESGMTAQEKRLLGLIQSGEVGGGDITYGRLIREKNLIGKALKREESPYGSLDEATLKRLYGALATDQLDNVGRIGGEELRAELRGANLIYAKERALGDRIVNAFGKDLEGGIASKMRSAITGAAKGDVGDFARLMKTVPADLRKEVVATALTSASRSARGAEKGGFGFSEFADLYPKLRANPQVYKQVVEALGPKASETLRDLFQVSKRITEARANVLTTGKANQALVESLNAEGLIAKIMGSTLAKRSVGAAAGIATGGLSGAVMPDLMQAMTKGNPDAVRAAGKMFVSPEFQSLLTETAIQPEVTDLAINRVASSQRFRDFAKAVGIELKQGRNWLRSAITVGSVGEMRPEPGPPEGAIMMRPQ